MKDLKISYENDNGETIKAEYNTIMDFIDTMNSNNIDIPMLDYGNVEAMFFENKLIVKRFGTIDDLLNHCIEITK
jgi:hypothetical protein